SLKLNQAASAPFDWLFLEMSRLQLSQRNDPSTLSQTMLQELINTKNALQGKATQNSNGKQAQAWLEQEQQKQSQKRLTSVSFTQTRYLEIPLFMDELKKCAKHVDSSDSR
ncbi:MAG: hypothetical protein IT423_24280, partial [Pirellulaceae bacterium]|nr:hypothetical protein [Pirellulaceae bacterium]